MAIAEYGGKFGLGDQDVLNTVLGQDETLRLWLPIPSTYNCQPGSAAAASLSPPAAPLTLCSGCVSVPQGGRPAWRCAAEPLRV